MRKFTKTIFVSLLVVFTSIGTMPIALGQFGTSIDSIRDLVRRIQNDTETLRRSAQNDRLYRVNELNQLIASFDAATNQLERRLGTRRSSTANARLVLNRAVPIDRFFVSNRVEAGTLRNWQTLRVDLDQLARAYNLSWQWSSGDSTSSNLSDIQLRQLVQSINTRTTTFSRYFRRDLNRRDVNDNNSIDEVRRQLSSFEMSVMQARDRTNTHSLTSADVSSTLQQAALLNNYVSSQRLSYQTENNWNALRSDLDRLAAAYSVAWNWSNRPGGGPGYPANDLNGTYRIASGQSDDARRVVDDATRNLSLAERQRVYDSLVRRLDPPEMLAIQRRGTSVTIASTRAPQISFVADGREQVETQNGRTVRFRAQLTGDELTISRTGNRADDFTVNFNPVNGSRRLLVTRTLYSERIPQPVTVRTYYDRTSDIAQLDIYETNREDPGNSGNVIGTFIVPNGTQLVAVLNSDLSTKTAQDNERFTMTVRSPGQYEGATIEGYVTDVSRSGRVTGRSELTIDFDTIRLRDGRTYRFAGILETVRTPDGEIVKVDNEGAVKESDQTNKTITRTAIGSAVGAIIGGIAGGGKGAAIGAVIGAGAGAGSVYVQGRDDLDLNAGTELTVRATGPRG